MTQKKKNLGTFLSGLLVAVLVYATLVWTTNRGLPMLRGDAPDLPVSTPLNAQEMLAQEMTDTLHSYCPWGASTTGGGQYIVWGGEPPTARSRHTDLEPALIAAAAFDVQNPGGEVSITHDFHLRVQCDPPSAASVDSITLDVHAQDYIYDDDTGDFLYVIGYDRQGNVVDTVYTMDYQRQALLWSDGEVVACAGRCDDLPTLHQIDYHQAMLIYNQLGRE